MAAAAYTAAVMAVSAIPRVAVTAGLELQRQDVE